MPTRGRPNPTQGLSPRPVGLAARLCTRLLAPREMFYVVTHERSGTHLFINTLIRNTVLLPAYHNLGEWWGPYDRPTDRFDHVESFNANWPALRRNGSIIKSHATRPLFEARYRPAKVVYIHRDPRDTLVSFYRYLNHDDFLRCNPHARDHRCQTISEFLQRPASDFLRYSYSLHGRFENVVDRWATHVRSWMDQPDVLHLRFEEILHDYEAAINRAARFLGLWKRWKRGPVALHDMPSILPGPGKIGTWRRYLNDDDCQFIRERVEAMGLSWDRVAWEPEASEQIAPLESVPA